MLIEVITGTTRAGRFSEKVANWVIDRLKGCDAFDVELLDLRDHPLPFFDGAAPARTGRDYPRDDVARFAGIIERADGYVVLTGEYNHGYPAVLKNAMDWTQRILAFDPDNEEAKAMARTITIAEASASDDWGWGWNIGHIGDTPKPTPTRQR